MAAHGDGLGAGAAAGRPPISEVGSAEGCETLELDMLTGQVRGDYYRGYMEVILLGLSEGVNLIGMLAWSFVDNLEWLSGVSVKFGI